MGSCCRTWLVLFLGAALRQERHRLRILGEGLGIRRLWGEASATYRMRMTLMVRMSARPATMADLEAMVRDVVLVPPHLITCMVTGPGCVEVSVGGATASQLAAIEEVLLSRLPATVGVQVTSKENPE